MSFISRLFKGSLKIPFSFTVNSSNPIDDRTVVSDISHLSNIDYWLDFEDGMSRLYPGLIVSVTGQKTPYMYIGTTGAKNVSIDKWIAIPNKDSIENIRKELLTKITTIESNQGAAFIYKGDIANEAALYNLAAKDVKAGHIYHSVADDEHFIAVGHSAPTANVADVLVPLYGVNAQHQYVQKITPINYSVIEDQVGSWLTASAKVGKYPVKLAESSTTQQLDVYIAYAENSTTEYYLIADDGDGVCIYLKSGLINLEQAAESADIKYTFRTTDVYTWDPFGSRFTLEWS